MKRFFFKNFILTACLFLLSFLVFGIALYFTGRAYLQEEKRQTMYTCLEETERTAGAFRHFGGLYSLDLRMSLTTMARSTGNHIFLCDQRGHVVSCSDMEWVCDHQGKFMSGAVIQSLYNTGRYEAMTSLDNFYETEHFVIAEPITTHDGRFLGYAFVSYDPSGFNSAWARFIGIFAVVSVLVLSAAVLLEWLNAGRRSKPLRAMAEAAHSFSKGNYAARVPAYEGESGIAELTDSFNIMAENLERNESLRRELIANVSHELRSPMTSIAGFADGLLDGTIAPEEQDKYLRTISAETKRLSRMVRSMLDMSRLQEDAARAEFENFDHTELFLQVLVNFESRINEKQLEVELELPEEPLMAHGSPDSLTQVIYNLLDNAVKFSEPATPLSLRLWEQDGKILTSIGNRGPGIPPEELPLIFDRFHKTDRSRSEDREGVGLGLYIVKSILDSHDEDIFVTSKDGVTRFTFTLPEAL